MRKLNSWTLGVILCGMASLGIAEEVNPGQAAQPAAAQTQPARKKTGKKRHMKKSEGPKKEDTKQAMYKCEHCNTTSDKPGKCPMCGAEMKKI